VAQIRPFLKFLGFFFKFLRSKKWLPFKKKFNTKFSKNCTGKSQKTFKENVVAPQMLSFINLPQKKEKELLASSIC
jgi:hypothetical protein